MDKAYMSKPDGTDVGTRSMQKDSAYYQKYSYVGTRMDTKSAQCDTDWRLFSSFSNIIELLCK